MKKTGLWILIGIWIGFIFFNSLQVGATSSVMSGRFTQLIVSLLEGFGTNPVFTTVSLWVRKLAHVGEFFILGALLVFQELPGIQRRSGRFFRILLYTLTIAIIDEIIQTFIPGRAGLLLDVGIDMIGATLAACGVFIIPKKIMMKDKKNNDD
ncbi:MAG: VanZ family protein [Bacilli bacterium]